MNRSSGLILLMLVGGCAATNGDDLQYSSPADSGGSTTGDGGVKGGGGKDGGGGTGGDTGGGNQGDDGGPTTGDDSGPTTGTGGLVQGLSITDIAIFQGSKVPIVTAGAKATPKYVPVVAGGQGLLRVYVSGTVSKPVTAELTLTSATAGTQTLTDPNRTLSGASTDGSLNSTFNIDIPPGALAADTTFSVRLLDPSAPSSAPSGSNPARYPNDGTAVSIGASSDGPSVTVTLVPVKYNADGSGRLPDTSAAQQKIYSDFLTQTYPVAKLDLQVHAPVDYSAAIGATSTSEWSDVLDFVLTLRDSDNPAANNYYYGIFEPSAPDAKGGPGNYCRSGCILGIAPLTQNANDTTQRGGVGAGYSGLDFATTMAQEIGHSCGLNHAPYPAQGSANAPASPDPNYPYASAYIGQWGYGFLDKKLYDPAVYRDFMSYAEQSIWVSDYVQGLFFKRFKTVNHASVRAFQPIRYERIYVWNDGGTMWGNPSTYQGRPQGEVHTVEFRDASGAVIATSDGQYFGLDTSDGGYLLVPDAPPSYSSVRIQGFGGTRELAR